MTQEIPTIIDNREGNTLLAGIQRMGAGGRELFIATAFFSLDGLLLLADAFENYARVRVLFGDDASPTQRKMLLERLRLVSDRDLLAQREREPLLSPLQKVEALFASGRIEARCYTANKFHAKAYLVLRPEAYPSEMAVIGSGNFTRPGLLKNIELNVQLSPEQTAHLKQWYEERWQEASEDIVTDDVLKEIRRQIDLYDPYYLYLKALYTWGQDRQGDSLGERTELLQKLDKHEEDGYLQALKIIERQHGVMVCDGVGLGKSFIALALMEHFCRTGHNVLLIAPKNILNNSWNGYLQDYMSRYRSPFGNIHEMAMTALGFDADGDESAEDLDLVRRLCDRADVIVIDESHNFRTRSANRYQNLYRIIEPLNGRRKKIVMLTATPLNTYYTDLSSQLALVTHEDGSIGAYSIEQIRKATRELDGDRREADLSGQLALQIGETPSETLNKVLEQVVIQRSRATCKALSAAVGRPLKFPVRKDPVCIRYKIGEDSSGYRELIELSDRRFRPGVKYLEDVRKVIDKLREDESKALPKSLLKGPPKGIKLAAFLTEQYRREPAPGSKQYQDEVHLAGLVFANTLKQLESSPPAFQGIIQSIGTGLIARLQYVLGGEAKRYIDPHRDWVRTPIFDRTVADDGEGSDPDIAIDGETLDASGEEADEWLLQAVRARKLEKKLAGFAEESFEVDRWRDDIVGDLDFLGEIHEAILKARRQPDPKLERVCPVIRRELDAGKRVLVFTQSQRTAEYLDHELRKRLKDYNVARVDSRVEETRAAIVHAFCPGYNPAPAPDKWPPSVPRRVDILISTDILSEGVNLQEASAIVNYDIHWNPVRLIQRIGRVDRRLDPEITPHEHEFAIYNVLPPTEIEKIIQLVASVERRTIKISEALGIDVSFFKADDPAGTLKEFNARYEGKMTMLDVAATRYIDKFDAPDPRLMALLDQIPTGAFGVWGSAPDDGLFALFTMEATASASDRDKEQFAQVIGRPVLALQRSATGTTLDAGAILGILAGTKEGERSATPSSEEELSKRLTRLKNSVRSAFADIELPKTILPKLVCWMDLRKEH